ARDHLDAQMRRRCPRSIDFERLLEAAEMSARDSGVEVPRLFACLRALRQWRDHAARSKRPSEWASAIAQALQSISASAAGDRSLDSTEYQALARWQELLSEFAALDRVVGRLAPAAAISKLERVAREIIFQPEGGAPLVQVLGVLEANALTFDHLWIVGLTAEAWPPPSRSNPLLPIELQRAAGMPGSSATTDLQRARRQLQQLIQSAPEVIVSHATVEGDRQVAPSQLIASFEPWTPAPRAARVVDAMTPISLVASIDAMAPAWQPIAPLRGGASIMQNQAACSFRAFAIHRLDAKAIESPHDGFDYRERGQLVHDTLAHFWTSLPQPTRDELAATTDQQRRVQLRAAAEAALSRLQRRRGAASAALTGLESARLMRVVEQWLQYEVSMRSAFRIAAIEESRTMNVGPLTITARLDRVDECADGSRIVIDYKTGSTKSVGWLEPRPEEPQLPLYLTASEPAARAIALARVRVGDVGITAYTAEAGLLPGKFDYWKNRFPSWDALVDHWSIVLDRLAAQFAAGDAAVNPKYVSRTCRYCDLPTFCRINERGATVIASIEDDEDSPWMRNEE
ncbi:MAG: PD-(D/E)XK nuclease family protein, partial [Burkholderiaceae bacterium]